MTDRDELIDKLSKTLSHMNCHGHSVAAKEVAEHLADVLGNFRPETDFRFLYSWISIWEARGNFQEAIRLQEMDIGRRRDQLESGFFDGYPDLQAEAIDNLQDCYYLQALRFRELSMNNEAVTCLTNARTIAMRYCRPVDLDVQSLLEEFSNQ